MKLITYGCPKCGQTVQVRARRPPVCWNPNSPWCHRRGVVMEAQETT